MKIYCLVSPRSPKWIERKNTRLKHQSEQFVREGEPTKGGGALKRPAPLCSCFRLPKFFEHLLKSRIFPFNPFWLAGALKN